LVTLATLVLVAFAGRELYAIRLSELGELYAKEGLRAYPPPSVTPASGPTLLADALISPGSQPGDWPERQGLGQRRPLILVCTSGGGVRAATWTAGLLSRFAEQVPDFSALTMMVTGASGGMVGASYWLTERKRQLEQDQALDYERLTRAVSRDCLTTITRTLVLNDLPRAIIGGVNRANRAARMQDVWQAEARKVGLDLTQPISAFREAELAGALPSLVFSPMIVEDGRRLLLSNLRLASVSQAEALWLEDATEGRRTVASCNAFHAADVLGPAGDAISLATAARLSASFPYISPAALLPTRPRTRVVDAGYYDNFGIDLVTGWLREALEHSPEWLEAHVSSILVIQIRDDESPLGQPDGSPRALPPPGTGLFAGLARGLQGLSTPLQGVIAARNSVMQLRNDAQLDAMARAYQARFERDVLVYETFELKGDISLSWYLTEIEYQKILGQLGAKGINEKIGKIARWVTAKPPV
jgi:hypothetical protein